MKNVIRIGILCMLSVLGFFWIAKFFSIGLTGVLCFIPVVLLPVSEYLYIWGDGKMEIVSMVLEAISLVAMVAFTINMFLPL